VSAGTVTDEPDDAAPGIGRASEHRLPIHRVHPSDPERVAKVSPKIEQLTWYLDDAIAIPGTTRRFGLDGIVGLIPGVGDMAGLAAGLVVVAAGVLGGVSVPTILRMLWNVTIDATIGAIPFFGDAFDVVNKTNTRNLKLINEDLADRSRTARRSMLVLLTWCFGITAFVAGLLLMQLLVLAWILSKIF